LAERGLNDTKIEDVAAATGIAKATLSYYFAGKEDILAFLLEDALREIADDAAAVVDADGTGAERLSGVISAQLRVDGPAPSGLPGSDPRARQGNRLPTACMTRCRFASKLGMAPRKLLVAGPVPEERCV
jgi:AcrR family transcriptional regulator